jgi:hypothetical protein
MGNRVRNGTIGMAMVAGVLLGAAAPVGAAISHCFLKPEIEAQEAVRYQEKLMVLSDTCGAEIYRRFTIRNRAAIVRYQDELVEHFRRTGSRHAEQSFDTYITGLANQFSLSAGSEPLTSLCSDAAAFLAQADKLDHDQFDHLISALAAEPKNAYLLCAK